MRPLRMKCQFCEQAAKRLLINLVTREDVLACIEHVRVFGPEGGRPLPEVHETMVELDHVR